jgi:hypothetical protein
VGQEVAEVHQEVHEVHQEVQEVQEVHQEVQPTLDPRYLPARAGLKSV